MNKTTNRGYVVPVAIGVLVLASLGLLAFSWSAGPRKSEKAKEVPVVAPKPEVNKALLNDDETIDEDSMKIDSQINELDKGATDINNSLNDKSSI